MKIAFFDTHKFEREIFKKNNKSFKHEITFFGPRLNDQTAMLAKGFSAVCCFANDKLDKSCLETLNKIGVRLIALRSAGYNHVDLKVAKKLKIPVVRVPAYSPHAVAEHTVALLLALDRKIYKAYNRVRDWNFSLEGLVGFDLFGKTVGVIGTGKIGKVFARIMKGFGCKVLGNDIFPSKSLIEEKVLDYVDLNTILKKSDIISLHVPLLPDTRHMLNKNTFSKMKKGVCILNTGRGALIDSMALIDCIKSGKVGLAGLDVYEEEEGIFFHDLSNQVIKDDTLARLMSFPNVLITSHQAFLTKEALENISRTTLENISAFEDKKPLKNEIHFKKISSRP
jgi:D-lactate dehydrogenase